MKHYIQAFGRQIELTEEQARELQERFSPPAVKLAELVAGETFFVGPHEMFVLEQFEDSAAVVRNSPLDKSVLFGKNNCYDGSDADTACNQFADEIAVIVGADALVEHTVDLTSDDGLKDYGVIRRKASLLTTERYRKYVDILDLHKVDRWCWLATPHSTKRHENDRWVKCVSPSGNLFNDYCSRDYIGVRPFCILKSDIFVSK